MATVRYIRGIANTPAGTVADMSGGAAQILRQRGIVEIVPAEAAETDHATEPEQPAEPEIPRPSDHKSAWIDYAVSRGFTRESAQEQSKRELIAALS